MISNHGGDVGPVFASHANFLNLHGWVLKQNFVKIELETTGDIISTLTWETATINTQSQTYNKCNIQPKSYLSACKDNNSIDSTDFKI